jgi:hypothetical protein
MPVMTDEWHVQNKANTIRWMQGNEDAIQFIYAFFDAVELWDDLIDKDVAIDDAHINQAFGNLMFSLPANDFFIAHRSYFLPLIMMGINGFHDANELCKSDKPHLRNLAFHIRNLGIELIIATTFIIGGYEYMRKVSPEIREFFAFESFEEWELNHG